MKPAAESKYRVFKYFSSAKWSRIVRILLCLPLILALAVQSDGSSSTIYRCKNESGVDVFTNIKSSKDCETFIKDPDPIISEILDVNKKPVTGSAPRPDIVTSPLAATAGLNHFFSRLEMLQAGEISQVTIYHVGDSHVRATAFPRRLASMLQAQFGTIGSGYCQQPAPPVVTAKKRKASPAAKSKKTSSGRQTRRVTLPRNKFYESASRDIKGTKRPDIKPSRVSSAPEPKVREVVVTEKPAQRSVPCENIGTSAASSKGISYNIYGEGGKTFSWFTASETMHNHLREFKPDLVIVTLGTNDAFAKLSYETAIRNIDQFVSTVRSYSPQSAILLTTPPDSFFRNGSNNQHIYTLKRAITDYAQAHNLAVWDFNTTMGGEGSMIRWYHSGLANSDLIHLSAAGSRMKGELLYDAIMKSYTGYSSRGR